MTKTLDLTEAADFLKVHPKTAERLARQGTLPGAKVGRSWVFIEMDLVEYLRKLIRVRQGPVKTPVKRRRGRPPQHPPLPD